MRTSIITATAAMLLQAAAVGCSAQAPEVEENIQDVDKLTTVGQMVAEVRERYPTVEGIGAAEVQDLIESGEAVLVDVRPDAERSVSTLSGSVTAEEFKANPGLYDGRVAVAFCTVGERSARFAEEMADAGVAVLNFEGSLLAWTHAGGSLVDGNGPTKALHVYGPRWDLAADGYETVW